jgi:hypothetical protein
MGAWSPRPRKGEGAVRASMTGVRILIGSGIVVAAAAAAVVPWLPATPDLYVHLLWSWEVARCLASGVLPVWLPDLNAGFGSPGIRLYSPLGPLLEGATAMGLGSVGAALRVVPVLVWGAFLLVARRGGRSAEWAVVLAAPPVLYSLLGRGAWSEFLAVPLLWWLTNAAVDREVVAVRDGLVLACLWLLHAPTTVMAVLVMGAAAVVQRSARLAQRLVLAGVVAAGLTAWHWLPLASEMALTDRTTLTGGIFAAWRNVLGSPTAHAIDENIWLGWCAVALLAALALRCSWRTDPLQTAIAVVAVGLASPLAAAIYAGPSPLGFLQFPSRWLLVGAVLAAKPLCRRLRTPRALAAIGLILLPLVVFPSKGVVRDPGLRPTTPWPEAGRRVFASFGGNPFVVDATQNRPGSWRLLGANLLRFGDRDVLLSGSDGRARVTRWSPLDREVEVNLTGATRVGFRVLDYPYWQASLDGVAVAADGVSGVPEVTVPVGHHMVALRWMGDPLARVGWAFTAAASLALAWAWVHDRRRRDPVSPPARVAGADG